jgi:hypothetical protein
LVRRCRRDDIAGRHDPRGDERGAGALQEAAAGKIFVGAVPLTAVHGVIIG